MGNRVDSTPIAQWILTFLVLAVVACSGSEESTVVTDDEEGPIPSATEARKALNEALQAFNRYCLTPSAQGGESSYPISLVSPGSSQPSFRYRQLWALTQAGLLDTTMATTNGGLSLHRFHLSASGRQSQYEIAQGQGYTKMFCYAVPRVTELDSIKARYNAGPNALAQVWFKYSYEDLGRWVESPPIQRTFSGLSPIPSARSQSSAEKLLVRVDSAWVDRRLTGYERPPARPRPPESR